MIRCYFGQFTSSGVPALGRSQWLVILGPFVFFWGVVLVVLVGPGGQQNTTKISCRMPPCFSPKTNQITWRVCRMAVLRHVVSMSAVGGDAGRNVLRLKRREKIVQFVGRSKIRPQPWRRTCRQRMVVLESLPYSPPLPARKRRHLHFYVSLFLVGAFSFLLFSSLFFSFLLYRDRNCVPEAPAARRDHRNAGRVLGRVYVPPPLPLISLAAVAGQAGRAGRKTIFSFFLGERNRKEKEREMDGKN